MAVACYASNGVAFFRWGEPQVEDGDEVVRHVVAIRNRHGGKIVMVHWVPPDAPPPSDEVRKELVKRFAAVMQECDSWHQVLEGSGFVNGLKRSVMTGMLIAARMSNVKVHATLDEVVGKAPAGRRHDVRAALDLLRAGALPRE